ncbi:protein FAM83H [Cyrtonyx montezumae]|uniref:protein FAM83H n=1 Tax=Cyrtonyx montezumae TaxID=9017 RepID=UPI0032DA5D24
MARRSQSSSQGDNPLDPNYLPPHYKEYYRLALDILTEEGKESYERFLAEEAAPDFLCSSEVDHILQNLQKPQYANQEGSTDTAGDNDMDGSSGTYWPMNSDLAVPELDLGWPMVFGFRGTEVTTLVQPPPPDNPSIKEEARRMIRAAQQVVAIVMDIFTDVDLLFEVLDAAARRVPVYILLDEMNAQLFLDTATKCRVNLNYVEFLRVRTVSGPTYYCRTGMSFKGHVKEKFLLVDCMVVLSGNYSFMWSFEKIHRSIAHIFQGELVSSFDEEFRILFAQSEPLVPPANVLAKVENPFAMAPFSNNMPFFPKKSPLMFQRDDSLFPSFMDRVDPDRYFLSNFRRDDMLRHTVEGSAMRMYKKVEMDNAQLDPVRGFLRSKQLELDAFKRHSFAEGTFENFASSKQYARQMFMNNMDEFKIQSSHFQKDQFYQYQFEHPNLPGRPQGFFDRIRGGRPGFNELEEGGPLPYVEGHRYPELEPSFPQEGFPLRLDYVPSNSSREVRHGSDQLNPAGNGPMGMMMRRQNIGQKFMCQTSPTQKQSLEQRLFFQDKDEEQDQDKNTQENRTGLRNWRISSYLSAYQSEPEEGLPMPMESEAYNDILGDALTKHSTDLIPAFKSPVAFNSKSLGVENAKEFADAERAGEETPTMKQDAFRSRINPLIQRSSRLRSSLIFNAAKLDQPNATVEKVQVIHKEQASNELTKDGETIKTAASSKVAELLEKYKAVGKDAERATLTHTKAVSSFLQEESQSAEKKCTKSVQYKILESRVLEAKDSCGTYRAHGETDRAFGMAASTPPLMDTLMKDPLAHLGAKVDKLSSRFYPMESKAALPEKESLIFVGDTQKLALPEKKDRVTFREDTEKSVGAELTKAQVRTSAALGLENPPRGHGSDGSLHKPEEDCSKQEQNPMEFFRKGSLRLKHLLNPKGEKKADEEPNPEAMGKCDRQPTAIKRSSVGDCQEMGEEEKTHKFTAPLPPKSTQPTPGRFPSSTANILYSSNLRDDTKVILEQISANSQKNRAELAKQLPSTSNPDLSKSTASLERKGDKDRGCNIHRSESFGSQKRSLQRQPSEDRDTLLKKMENMRKEKRVYSRFEVFCKKDEHASPGEEDYDADAKDKKVGKFQMPKILGTFKSKK